MDPISGKDIIIVGLQPWDTEIGSNCKNIALEFSRHNRVLYVNSPLDRITKLRRGHEKPIQKRIQIVEGCADDLEEIKPNLWVYYPDALIESINWIKIPFLFDFLNRRNNRKFAKSIIKATSRLRFSNYILFNDNDIFRSFYLKEYLRPLVYIYYSRDNLLGVDYWKHHGKRLEPRLMAKSDICVANSAYLTKICKLYNKNSYDIGQGCEVEVFSNIPKDSSPPDLVKIKRPMIGYVGALQSLRLDVELLTYIAIERKDWSLVLVGPEDSSFSSSKLHQLPNVFFIGSRSPVELPAYVNSFNVCINPQKVNEVTIGNYPRKIDEYLAVGKPVVATLTDSMLMFSDFVYLANSKEEYVMQIERAINEDCNELHLIRKKFASSHTWENSVKGIYHALSNL